MSKYQIIVLFFLTSLLCHALHGQETGTVTDIDGNVYQTVKIGDQWWITENLRVSRYRNGDHIPNVTGNADWGNLTSGAWAYYDNDESNDFAYGKLYNWHAVADGRGLCPAGWHVPDIEAWRQLELYLGMPEEEAHDAGWWGEKNSIGGKLKSTLTEPDPHPRWNDPNTASTNESDFSGLPGGYRDNAGEFRLLGKHGFWWSSTESFTDFRAWYTGLDYGFAGMLRYTTGKYIGMSVRCVMEQVTGINDHQELPKSYTLMQNFPNPFNPATVIRYGLPERSHVKLDIFNVLGQHVSTLVNKDLEAGYYEITFDANHLPSGVYIYRLQAGDYVEYRRMLYIR